MTPENSVNYMSFFSYVFRETVSRLEQTSTEIFLTLHLPNLRVVVGLLIFLLLHVLKFVS